jgi:hypothetical protein
MVNHPVKGWIRVGNSYANRKDARCWVSFVRGVWHGLMTKVVACTVVWRDGKPDKKSRDELDKKFNLDIPNTKN